MDMDDPENLGHPQKGWVNDPKGFSFKEKREDGEENVPSASNYGINIRKEIKILLSVNSVLAWITLGMFLEVTGPTLPYLRDGLGVNQEEIARVLVARSVGYLIGALVGGVLIDKFFGFCYLFFSIGYLMASIGTIATPWCPNLGLMGLMFFLQGLCQGCTCAGSDAVQIRLWGIKAGPPLIAQHFGFGVGALIVPQITNAFVYDLPPLHHNNTFNETTSFPVTTDVDDNTYADLEYPYAIIGSLSGIFVFTFLFAFIYIRKYVTNFDAVVTVQTAKEEEPQNKSLVEILNPGTCAGGDLIFGLIMFSLLFLLYIDVVGGERAISKYLYTYAYEGDMGLTPSEATNLNSLFWLAFVCGRGINIFIAQFVSIFIICPVLVGGNLVTGIILASFGNSSDTVVWVFTALFGLFLSPLFPSTIVWADEYIEMTAVAVAIPYIGSAVGGMIFQYLGGYLFEEYGTHTLWYIILGYAITLFLIFGALQFVAWRHGPRRGRDDTEKKIFDENEDIAAARQKKEAQFMTIRF